MKQKTKLSWILPAALLLVGGVFSACSTDDPTEPQTGGPGPGSGTGSGQWTITVTSTQTALQPGQTTAVTVQVRDATTGAVPGVGTTISLAASLGTLRDAVGILSGGAFVTEFTAGTTQGTAVIEVTLESSIGRLQLEIAGDIVFLLSYVDPNVGDPAGGEIVSIVGQNILAPVRVNFGGADARVLSVTSSRIRIETPPSQNPPDVGSTVSINVAVTNAIGSEVEASDTLTNAFVYSHGGTFVQPQIFSVTPNTGPNAGGTTVRINGSGFQAPVQVLFGADDATTVEAQIVSVAPTEVVVLSPSATLFGQGNLDALVDITVINLDSGFRAVAPGAFRYGTPIIITAVAPAEVPPAGRVLVTVFGQGFDAPVALSAGGEAQSVVAVSGTEIVFNAVPVDIEGCGAKSGPVTVTNIETGSTASGPDFTYRALEPVIIGITPSSFTGTGGTLVTITGQNFEAPVTVSFGGVSGSGATVTPAGTITVTTPPFSSFDTQPCDDDGDGQQGEKFVPTAVDVEVENILTGCIDTVSGLATYTPTDTSCQGDAAPTPTLAQCEDGADNDGDGFVDHATVNPINPDPECSGPADDDESA